MTRKVLYLSQQRSSSSTCRCSHCHAGSQMGGYTMDIMTYATDRSSGSWHCLHVAPAASLQQPGLTSCREIGVLKQGMT